MKRFLSRGNVVILHSGESKKIYDIQGDSFTSAPNTKVFDSIQRVDTHHKLSEIKYVLI